MLNIKWSTPNINSRAPWLTAVTYTGPSFSSLSLTFSKTKQKQLAAFLPVVCDDKWRLMKKGTCGIYHLTISFWQIFWIKICTAPCFPYIPAVLPLHSVRATYVAQGEVIFISSERTDFLICAAGLQISFPIGHEIQSSATENK